MIDLQKLKESIDRAAGTAVERYQSELQRSLQTAVAELKKSVAQQVLNELEPELATPPGGAPTDLANAAIASIQDASTQSDILSALLAGAEKFSQRSGLFVVKGSQGTGWQARGFDADTFKQTKLDCSRGLAERAMRTRGPVAGAAAEFDQAFVDGFGAPADGNVILLPLVVRERVAALLYADGGSQGSAGLDASGIELLVRATDLWLEVISLRRLTESAGTQEAQEEAPAAAATAHAPEKVSVPEPQVAAVHQPQVEAPQAVATVAPDAPAVEDELHKKAKRFAKLLVDEIKLYNPAKVNEGRANGDIYDRLKEDIDKSRETYKKRFAESVTDYDYFTSELIRILAENDRAKMGANFRN